MRKLRGVGVREVIGNHGIEPWHSSHRHSVEVQRWLPMLERHVAALEGVWIEDKVFTVAIRYRQSREKRKARAAILEAAASLGAVRVICGKQVVNILPKTAPHKGLALERARARMECDTAIYVGDDETDEDVSALDPGAPARHTRRRQAWLGGSLSHPEATLDRRAAPTASRPSTGDHGCATGVWMTDADVHRLPALGEVFEFLRLIWQVDHAL